MDEEQGVSGAEVWADLGELDEATVEDLRETEQISRLQYYMKELR